MRLAELGEPLVQGEDVRQVQQALIAAGFDIEADGIFGKGTDRAVRQFQQQKGLTVDGIVGDETRRILGVETQ
ncbi:MAG: peptidoglycan-binding protein [Oscillatoriales cyanobacterium RU_3_3]|nr:peptidoglycan-binding protein [Oscillatoriales cyanobacterium RU_3_3]